jgi:hypothetical protein
MIPAIMIPAALGKRSDVQVLLVRWCWGVGDHFGDQSLPRCSPSPAGQKDRFWSPLRVGPLGIALCLRSQVFCYFPTICTGGGLP